MDQTKAGTRSRAQLALFRAVLLAGVLAAAVHADCPDAGIRCRIPISNAGATATSRGCSLSGSGSAPTVQIGSSCYQVESSSDAATYAVVGTITIGQCADPSQGGCQPQNCRGNDASKRCNERLPGCTVRELGEAVCEETYVAQPGDNCWAIANSNGMTLQELQGMNPGVCGVGLQPNTQLCMRQTRNEGPATPKCEGYKFSG